MSDMFNTFNPFVGKPAVSGTQGVNSQPYNTEPSGTSPLGKPAGVDACSFTSFHAQSANSTPVNVADIVKNVSKMPTRQAAGQLNPAVALMMQKAPAELAV